MFSFELSFNCIAVPDISYILSFLANFAIALTTLLGFKDKSLVSRKKSDWYSTETTKYSFFHHIVLYWICELHMQYICMPSRNSFKY